MKNYQEALFEVLDTANYKEDRTGTGTVSKFGMQMRFNLEDGFPLVTTKKVHFKSIAHELLWFLKGDTNIGYLKDNGVKIWNEWADPFGALGPIYGAQWRNWNNEGIDQIQDVIKEIKTNPDSRRLIVSAWNPSVLPDTSKSFAENVDNGKQALPPCHAFFQFYVSKGKLSCQLYQRSADMFLGVPYNIASYALLTHMIAQVTGLKVGDFVHSIGDAHIYSNHIDQIKVQLKREPMELCKLSLNPNIKNIDDFTYEDIKLVDYKSHSALKGKVAI